MDYVIVIVKHQQFTNECHASKWDLTSNNHNKVMLDSFAPLCFAFCQKNTVTQVKRNNVLVVFFYCIQCTFGTPSPCLSGAKLQNKELSASSSVDFHIQAQGLNRWPWRQSLMPSFRKSVTLYALFFPPSAVFLSHSKSQSARLIVEYAFTHHWFFFSLSSVTLQLHLHIPCFFFQPIVMPPVHHSCVVFLSGTNNCPFSGKEAQLEAGVR